MGRSGVVANFLPHYTRFYFDTLVFCYEQIIECVIGIILINKRVSRKYL